MKAHLLFYPLFLLTLTLFVSHASAQTGLLEPPLSIVFELDSIEFTAPPGTYQANGSILFQASAQDPDQVNGDFQYTLYYYDDSAPTGWVASNFSHVAVANRPGWLMHSGFSQTGPRVNALNNFTFNITAWNATRESIPSCLVNVTDIRILGTHEECGNRIDAPSGVGVIGTRAAQVGENSEGPISIPALTDVRWHFSPDDPNQTTAPNYSYYLFTGATPDALANYTGMTPTLRASGVLNFTVDTFTSGANQRFPFYAQIMARDNYTKQRSNFSCLAYVSGGSIRESGACGTYPVDLSNLTATGPHFPFLNLTQVADDSGSTVSIIGPFLGALTVLGFAGMGFVVNPTLGGSLGIVALGFVASMGLMPLWLLILLFMGALALIVLGLSKGGNTE